MPVFTEITGACKPDVLPPDPAGNPRLIQPTLDPATAAAISGAASAAPASSSTGWNGVQGTHRASLLGGKAIDDVIVHAKGDPELYRYKNDGHGNFR
ncbi:hypothetical protein, partial [Saccharothrix sp. ST-888]|uniref:hypothetical protein n=1 Tax=Saccharothrix sp. ST-888 TaxID=1427391 RepID=UPI0005EC6F88